MVLTTYLLASIHGYGLHQKGVQFTSGFEILPTSFNLMFTKRSFYTRDRSLIVLNIQLRSKTSTRICNLFKLLVWGLEFWFYINLYGVYIHLYVCDVIQLFMISQTIKAFNYKSINA